MIFVGLVTPASSSSMLSATDCAHATLDIDRHGIVQSTSSRRSACRHAGAQYQMQRALLLDVVFRQSSHEFMLSRN